MATEKFCRDDFLKWDNPSDKTIEKQIVMLVKALAKELSKHLGDHEAFPQKPQGDYIGANICHEKYVADGKKPQQIPHCSLGLVCSERRLRLYVQAEAKGLINYLLQQREKGFEAELVDALSNIPQNSDLSHISLRVERKWFLKPGAKGKDASWYLPVLSIPLDSIRDKKSVKDAVRTALDKAAALQEERITLSNLADIKSKTVIGVLQLDAYLNWFELEDSGTGILKELKNIVDIMKPYYQVLLKWAP